MEESDAFDFYVLLPSSDGKSFALAGGKFSEKVDYLYSDELRQRVKEGFTLCAHVLLENDNLFRRFNDKGDLEDFTQTGLYWATVWQNRESGETVYGQTDRVILRSDAVLKMLESGYLGQSNGFNFSRLTSYRGMDWYTGLTILTKPANEEKRYIWMVTIDGTAHGEYENSASSCLWDTYEQAKQFVQSNLNDDVVNACFQGCNATDAEIEKEVTNHCTWYGADQAQFRCNGAITDYKIEKVAVPDLDGGTEGK